MNKIATENALVACDAREPPVAFLDSLLLGEVIKFQWKENVTVIWILLSPQDKFLENFLLLICYDSGKTGWREASSAMTSLPVKPRSH